MNRYTVPLLLLTAICLLPLIACGDAAVTATAPFYDDADVIHDSSLEGRWILYGGNRPMGYYNDK